ITIESRRGKIALYARADDGMPQGAVFVPFCYYEAAANMLTNPVLDPFGKIPEFKYCAVRVTRGGPTPVQMSFGGGTPLNETPSGLCFAKRRSASRRRQGRLARNRRADWQPHRIAGCSPVFPFQPRLEGLEPGAECLRAVKPHVFLNPV